jgi:CBS domain-containing protein
MNNTLSAEVVPRVVLGAATAADLMTPDPLPIAADATVSEAAAFLAGKGYRAAPVIDAAGRPIGVLSQSDLVLHERETNPCVSGHPEYYAREELGPARIIRTNVVDGDPTCVRDLMTPVVFSVAPETPANQVIGDMLAHQVHHLFVVGGGGVLLGIISTVDVLRRLHLEQSPAPGREASHA